MVCLKAKARAHPMQGLVKYHRLKDKMLSIPFHDSISVNVEALHTETEVKFGDFKEDELWINGVNSSKGELRRCQMVLDRIRWLSGLTYCAKGVWFLILRRGSSSCYSLHRLWFNKEPRLGPNPNIQISKTSCGFCV